MTTIMNEAKKEFDECLKLMFERGMKYGDSWKDARLSSLVDYVIMKYNRVNKMAEDPIANKEKIISDLQDACNYAIFAIVKIKGGQ